MLYRREVIFIVYVDVGIFTSPSDVETSQTITEIGAKFYIEYQGTLNNYTRSNIEYLPDENIKIL